MCFTLRGERWSPTWCRRTSEITRAVAEAASRLPDPSLPSLDAVHLATALQLSGELEALVTYDRRLAAAAGRQRLPVVTP
jgi:uncharacterized protein